MMIILRAHPFLFRLIRRNSENIKCRFFRCNNTILVTASMRAMRDKAKLNERISNSPHLPYRVFIVFVNSFTHSDDVSTLSVSYNITDHRISRIIIQ